MIDNLLIRGVLQGLAQKEAGYNVPQDYVVSDIKVRVVEGKEGAYTVTFPGSHAAGAEKLATALNVAFSNPNPDNKNITPNVARVEEGTTVNIDFGTRSPANILVTLPLIDTDEKIKPYINVKSDEFIKIRPIGLENNLDGLQGSYRNVIRPEDLEALLAAGKERNFGSQDLKKFFKRDDEINIIKKLDFKGPTYEKNSEPKDKGLGE